MPAPATRSRRTPKVSGDDRERAILAAFERLLEERSLHEVSIDDIARGAGISRPTFYFYFASKEAVLLSLFERLLAEGQRAPRRRARPPGRGPRRPRPRVADRLPRGVPRAQGRHARRGRRAGDEQRAARRLGATSWRAGCGEVAGAIEAERARGAAPQGVPARELAISLLLMNERVLHTRLRRPRAGGRGGRGRGRAASASGSVPSTAPPSRAAPSRGRGGGAWATGGRERPAPRADGEDAAAHQNAVT